jgi:hypothetical protein
VHAPGDQIEVTAGGVGVRRLAEGAPFDRDVGVAGYDEAPGSRDGGGLAAGVLDDLVVGVPPAQLLDPGDDDIESDSELLEDLAALGRAGCERYVQEDSSGTQIPISRSADSSESDPWTML